MNIQRVLRRAALAAAVVCAGCDPTRPFRVLDDPRPVQRVVVAPDTVRISLGDTATFTARVLAAGDREAREYPVTWTSGNPGVAAVAGSGRFVAAARGTSEILATAAGVRGRAVLVVR